MKKFYFLLVAVTIACSATGQSDTTYWKRHLKLGLNINQAAFSSNWIGGGVNSIGFNTYLNYKANYKKGKTSWRNEIDLIYGFQNNEGQGFRKTNDRLYIDSKVGQKIGASKWNLFFSANFLTQFDKGFKFDVEDPATGEKSDVFISDFLAPAYLTLSLGLEYKPVDYFFLRISPLSPRFTFVTNKELVDGQEFNYGVEPGNTSRAEWAAFQFVADFDQEIAKNLNMKSKYLLFWNYERPVSEAVHRFDILFSAKVNNFLAVDLGGQLIYDIDQIDEVQYNQIFSLGLIFEFRNFEPEK